MLSRIGQVPVISLSSLRLLQSEFCGTESLAEAGLGYRLQHTKAQTEPPTSLEPEQRGRSKHQSLRAEHESAPGGDGANVVNECGRKNWAEGCPAESR
jgi:hypothetical protein